MRWGRNPWNHSRASFDRKCPKDEMKCFGMEWMRVTKYDVPKESRVEVRATELPAVVQVYYQVLICNEQLGCIRADGFKKLIVFADSSGRGLDCQPFVGSSAALWTLRFTSDRKRMSATCLQRLCCPDTAWSTSGNVWPNCLARVYGIYGSRNFGSWTNTE